MTDFDFSDEELAEAEARIKKLARNPRFVSGIYNYCDRWCERCPVTSKCMLFAQENMERADDADDSRDLHNEKFWRKIAKNFAVTRRMILNDMKKRGIDPAEFDSPEFDKEMEEREKRRRRVTTLDIPKTARRYAKWVDNWFTSHKELFDEKTEQLKSQALMDIEGDDPEAQAAEIGDAIEIVRFYQHQIFVKMSRSLSGLEDAVNEDDEDWRSAAQSDADGSAKVALIGIDRSIAAWARLREHFSSDKDEILDTLVTLDRLRRKIEKVLPGARTFFRPGLDGPAPKRKGSSRKRRAAPPKTGE